MAGEAMNKKIRWITETAVMLALLITLQAVTKGFGQLVTGSCVNTLLAVSVLAGGLGCGLTVALVSPVMAFLLGIAPQILTVPAIMAGNAALVCVLYVLAAKGRKLWHRVLAWLVAAAAKFAVLYAIVNFLICGVLSQSLLSAGMLKPPMLNLLPATFGLLQLITALIGGGLGLLIARNLRNE